MRKTPRDKCNNKDLMNPDKRVDEDDDQRGAPKNAGAPKFVWNFPDEALFQEFSTQLLSWESWNSLMECIRKFIEYVKPEAY